jgi:hypothetical protein
MKHSHLPKPRLACGAILLALLAAPVLASAPVPNGAAAAAGPLDARAAAGVLRLERPLRDGYRRYDEQPGPGWREANDTVARIGGWRSYAREAQPAASSPATPPAVRP